MLNPRPDPSWLDDHYQWLADSYFLHPAKISSDFREGRFHLEWPLLDGLNGRLLDVGCADGPFVSSALKRGFDASGIDIMESAVEFGRTQKNLDLRCGDFTHSDLPTASFDVVTMWATLEHLAEPAPFLREAHRVVRPGGHLVVSVPNSAGLVQRLLGRHDRYVCVEHLNYFLTSNLSLLLVRHGFSVDRVETRGINPMTLFSDTIGTLSKRMVSPDKHLRHQMTTDTVKTSAKFELLRRLHGGVERRLSCLGLGTLMLARARRI